MQFKEEKRERDIFKEISRQAEMIFFFQKTFWQSWLSAHQKQSRTKISLSLKLFPKTTSKYLSFETNLASVAQTVQKWEQFKEKQFSLHLFNFFHFFTQRNFISSRKRIRKSRFFPANPWNLSAKNCKLTSSRCFFQNLASSFSYCVMSSYFVTVQKNHTVSR